jgi:rare lipoprotein A
MKKLLMLPLIAYFFSACATTSPKPDYQNIIEDPTPQTKYKKLSKKELKHFSQIGIASYYGYQWNGRTTANGEKLNIYALTAAHKYLPFNTLVKVTDLDTKKSIVVRINDRGPYIHGRVIDLTDTAAKKLGILHKGIARVKIEVIGEA